eukprot:gnl/MRDRNA2_/MRDRNA2_58026_c0_seq2.p1 gnl/MRDRNA2_/MRDRNA2_58026_c0~~gnl/MRDRNA2_/MRDRNA2_58026_c0_seq2.p1  ORF type:complete len:105 (-),score=12.89 gnl/MRDRNA2_/MRDRNA2_58026_c0_seq2:193-507(-)
MMTTKYQFVLFLVFVCRIAEGLRRTLPSQTLGKTAHIYVVNIPARKDRCRCMQKQLAGAPFPSFLFEATLLENLQEHCPDAFEHHEVSTIRAGPYSAAIDRFLK